MTMVREAWLARHRMAPRTAQGAVDNFPDTAFPKPANGSNRPKADPECSCYDPMIKVTGGAKIKIFFLRPILAAFFRIRLRSRMISRTR